MSTNVAPVVAHDEKCNLFIFLPEISYGKHRNAIDLLLNPPKNHQIVTIRSLVKNTQNLVTHTQGQIQKVQKEGLSSPHACSNFR